MTQTLDKAWGQVIQAMEDCEFLAAEERDTLHVVWSYTGPLQSVLNPTLDADR